MLCIYRVLCVVGDLLLIASTTSLVDDILFPYPALHWQRVPGASRDVPWSLAANATSGVDTKEQVAQTLSRWSSIEPWSKHIKTDQIYHVMFIHLLTYGLYRKI